MEGQVRWVNNFWGQDDAGYRQLMMRVHNAKQTCDELKQFYRDRLSIEQEYAKKLTALSRRALGSSETGGMKQSLEIVRSTTKATAATHDTVARQLSEQLIAPLDAFTTSMRGRTKTVEGTMGQLTRAKASQNNSSEKARKRYEDECDRIKHYQAQQNLLMGRELDKNNQKLDRATYQVEGMQRQYQDSLRALAQTMENWNAEWRVACDSIEQAEDERLTFLKSNLWAYANALSAACVADDESCETVRLSLERCDPAQDLESFSREFGTGSRIQDPPEFVNFLQGFSRENDSEDGHYHIANFGSTLNEGDVPDLAVPSPSVKSSDSPESQNGFQFTPMSSPGTTMPDDHYQQVKNDNLRNMGSQQSQQPVAQERLAVPQEVKEKKRRSWAMPFKRKSTPDFSNLKYVSALDQPAPSATASVQSSSHPMASQEPLQSQRGGQPQSQLNHQQYQDQRQRQPQQRVPPSSNPLDSRRQSWAPGSYATQSGNDGAGNDGEDPLLTALERLKTPNLKPRPLSMGYATPSQHGGPSNTKKGANPPSPYGNGNPSQFASPPSPLQRAGSPARKPIHRKQVGSNDMQLPRSTSDGRRVIKHCHAQYDYRAAIPEEVTFRKGDLLLITEMQEDGWWDCEVANRGRFGLAPSNFLTEIR